MSTIPDRDFWTGPPYGIPTLDAAVEAEMIAAALAGHDESVSWLLGAYRNVLVYHVGQAAYNASEAEKDDLRSAALEAFWDAVRAYDPSRGALFIGVLRGRLKAHLGLQSSDNRRGPSVPARTRSRYQAAMAAAGGDASLARDLAPTFSLSTAAFDSIHATIDPVTYSPFLEDQMPADDLSETERALLVQGLLATLEPDEEEIVRLAYGFVDGTPRSDEDVAYELHRRRSTVQRIRAQALKKLYEQLSA